MKRVVLAILMVVSLLAGGIAVSANMIFVKDKGNALDVTSTENNVYVELSEGVKNQLCELNGDGDYEGVLLYDNGADQIYLIVLKGEKLGWYAVKNGVVKSFDLDEDQEIFQIESSEDKITVELKEIMQISSNDTIPVYIWLRDINHEEVESSIPVVMNIETVESDQDLVVQKRAYYAETYQTYNMDFLTNNLYELLDETHSGVNVLTKTQVDDLETVEYVSSYSPMCILNLQSDQIHKLAESNQVVEIGYFPDVEIKYDAVVAMGAVQGDYVKENYGYKGSGVKVGIIEEGRVRNNGEFDNVNIEYLPNSSTVVSEHTTRVASIIAGENVGLAPDCSLYIAPTTRNVDIIPNIEWLIGEGVSVINCSFSFASQSSTSTDYKGEYSIYDKWFDHIDMNHDILCVVSSGNHVYVESPGMAYNVITVGGYNDKNTATAHTDDTLMAFSFLDDFFGGEDGIVDCTSGYVEDDGIAEKPDLIAPGQNIDVPGCVSDEKCSSGTSFAAPYVTATVAQIISAKPALATQPGQIKSILLASAYRKLDENSYGISSFVPYISDVEGVGKLDSKNAIYVAANTRYTYEYMYAEDFPYTKSLYIDAAESQIRVALCWLKQSVLNSGSHMETGNVVERNLSDLDLNVYDPNGNLVAYSRSFHNNVEIVEFDPTVSGIYSIKVSRIGGTTDVDFFYLAWW